MYVGVAQPAVHLIRGSDTLVHDIHTDGLQVRHVLGLFNAVMHWFMSEFVDDDASVGGKLRDPLARASTKKYYGDALTTSIR